MRSRCMQLVGHQLLGYDCAMTHVDLGGWEVADGHDDRTFRQT